MEPKHPLSPLFLLLSAAVSLLMLSAACGRSSQLRDTLQRAENLMEEHPDSAYALLAPLRVDTNDTPEDQALHALLLTQAMHKTYRIWRDSVENIAFSDSLIRIAVDHYEKNNNDARLMVSYYYQGEIEALSDSNFLHAIVPLSRSLEIALDRKDNYWIARNYNSMADVYFEGGAFGDEAEAQRMSVEHFMLTDREDFVKAGKLEYAIALHNSYRYDEALKVEDELLGTLSTEDETEAEWWAEAVQLKARTLFFKEYPMGCLEEINRLERAGCMDNELQLFRIISYIFLDDPQKAKEYYEHYREQLDEDARYMVENAFANINKDKDRQVETLKAIIDGLAKEYTEYTSTGFNTMQMAINRKASERHAKEKESIRSGYSSILFIMLTLGALVVSVLLRHLVRIYRSRQQEHDELVRTKEEKASLADEFENLTEGYACLEDNLEKERENSRNTRQQYEELDRRHTAMGRDHKLLMKEKDSMLMDLLRKNMQYEKSESDSSPTHGDTILYELPAELLQALIHSYITGEEDVELADSIRKEFCDGIVRTLRVHGPEWKHLEEKADLQMGNIMKELRKDLPGLQDHYYTLAIYLLMNLDKKSIAYLMNRSDSRGIYNAVGNLKSKIKKLPEEKLQKYTPLLKLRMKKGKRNGFKGAKG